MASIKHGEVQAGGDCKSNGYTSASDAQTIWIKPGKDRLTIHAIHADDLFHFTNSTIISRLSETIKEKI
jgi:hypothetical protein